MSALAGRTVVVTGATRGIGKAIATTLAGQGARVAVVGRSPERGQRVVDAIIADRGDAALFLYDLTQEDAVAGMFAAVTTRWGPIDAVVNNAAPTDVATRDRPVTEQTTADFDHFIRGGLHSVFWSFKHGIPAMGASGGLGVPRGRSHRPGRPQSDPRSRPDQRRLRERGGVPAL